MKKRTRSAVSRYEALLQVLRTADSLWNTSRTFFSRWEISPSQFNVLNLLSDRPDGLSQIELGRLLIMHRSNVTGLVDRLEARGLVRRDNAVGDRRAYRVVLTQSGAGLLQAILPDYFEMADKVWQGFTVSGAKQLSAQLSRLSMQAESLAKSGQHP